MSELPQGWGDMPLPPAVKEAIISLGWKAPTEVQSACVPILLKGKDVAVQSATGSGKTGAFCIPLAARIVMQRTQQGQGTGAITSSPTGLILCPSVELVEQTVSVAQQVMRFLKPRVNIENICTRATTAPPMGQGCGVDVIISTPAALAKLVRSGGVQASILENLRMVVIDEADMLVSMTSLSVLQRLFPPTVQTALVSATLTEGVEKIKQSMLRNATSINVEEEEVDEDAAAPLVEKHVVPAAGKLKHHYLVATDEAHTYTLLYGLFRLNLISGKTLVFVEDEQETYRLQHFLEQMSVSAVVYDASLPLNVRLETLKRFQRNSQGTLICTDQTLEKAERLHGDEESGLHRGVDFNKVANVIMFDGLRAASAVDLANYTHRAGRTARAGEDGMAISLFSVRQSRNVTHDLRAYLKARGEDLRAFKQMQRGEAAKLQYRVDSALANVTRAAARKLRVATVASELARSTYLQNHLGAGDSEAIKRIVKKVSGKVKADQSLAAVPHYMKVEADSVKDYRDRVKSHNFNNREQVFRRVTKHKKEDPLAKVISKVRQDEERRKAKKHSKAQTAKRSGGKKSAGKKK